MSLREVISTQNDNIDKETRQAFVIFRIEDVVRMLFLIYFFFFTPGCCQREQEAANICSRPTYVCMDSKQTRLRILDRLKDKMLRSSQLLLAALCVCGCVCLFLQLLYSEDQNAYFTTKAMTFF